MPDARTLFVSAFALGIAFWAPPAGDGGGAPARHSRRFSPSFGGDRPSSATPSGDRRALQGGRCCSRSRSSAGARLAGSMLCSARAVRSTTRGETPSRTHRSRRRRRLRRRRLSVAHQSDAAAYWLFGRRAMTAYGVDAPSSEATSSSSRAHDRGVLCASSSRARRVRAAAASARFSFRASISSAARPSGTSGEHCSQRSAPRESRLARV